MVESKSKVKESTPYGKHLKKIFYEYAEKRVSIDKFRI